MGLILDQTRRHAVVTEAIEDHPEWVANVVMVLLTIAVLLGSLAMWTTVFTATGAATSSPALEDYRMVDVDGVRCLAHGETLAMCEW